MQRLKGDFRPECQCACSSVASGEADYWHPKNTVGEEDSSVPGSSFPSPDYSYQLPMKSASDSMKSILGVADWYFLSWLML